MIANPPSRPALGAACLAGALLLHPESALAQGASQNGGEPRGGFVDTVEVNVVNVSVVVTDRSGEPVGGLTAEDFELFEDGERMDLSHFTQVDRGRPAAAPNADAASGEPAPEAPSEAAVEPLHLVIYVDNFNIRPQNRNRVLPEIRGFLEATVKPQDDMMVVVYGETLAVAQAFTRDHALVEKALKKASKAPTGLMAIDSEQQRILSDLDRADPNSIHDAQVQLQMFENAWRERTKATIHVLESFVKALAGLPGQKAILYVSDGLPMVEDSDAGSYRRITEQANANQVTFYAIDARGTERNARVDPSSNAPDLAENLEGFLQPNLRRSLQQLSDSTGGFAITNTFNVDGGLERVSAGLESYYSLAYRPGHGHDGAYHRIEVEVRGKGLKVRHREGYLDKPARDRMEDRTLAALTFGARPEDNPLGLGLEFGPREQADGAPPRVPLLIQLPLAKLVLLPQEGRYDGRVKLFVVVMAGDGRLAPVQEIELPIQLSAEQYEGSPPEQITYSLPLPALASGLRVAVGARDELAAALSFASAELPAGRR